MLGYYLLALISLVSANIEHDHTKHIDIDWVQKESRRVAWNKLDSILRQLEEAREGVVAVATKYDELVEPHKGDDEEERMTKLWEETYLPLYRQYYDRFLILHTVCHDVYNDPACKKHEDPWSNKYDGRGENFVTEFLAEVHSVIANDIPKIKESRRQKNEL